MQQGTFMESHLTVDRTGSGGSERARLSVLLLAHHVADAEAIVRCLESASRGYCDVQVTEQFSEMLALLQNGDFDVVLIDISSPERNDFEAVGTICEVAPKTAIIVLTSNEDTLLGTEAVQSGAQDYVIKSEESYASLWRTIHYAVERERMKGSLDDALGKLEHENEATRQVLNQLGVATLVIEADESVAFVSNAASQLLGLHSVGAIGSSWRRIVPGSAAHHELVAQCLRMENRALGRIPIQWRDGRGDTRHLEIEVVACPGEPKRMFLYLHDVTEQQRLPEFDGERASQMVGESDIMRAMYRQILDVARADWTVLIEGETGAGKELVARSIHGASRRRDGPFIAVNCAALTDSLLNSQLFGHRRGAFTGALSDREGVFESADGGTLFLDEIGDLPLAMQTSMLRVLQEKEIVRIGDSRPRKVDVRVITATHRNLDALAKQGEFRSDLLFRIKVGRIRVPPLRDRREDIPALAASFLASGRVEVGKRMNRISNAAMQMLQAYDWPGNVRELKNAIDYAIIYCNSGDTILPEHLPPEISDRLPASPPPAFQPQSDHPLGEAEDERSRIEGALRAAGGNRNRAAKLLGVSRATLYRRLSALGIGPKYPK